MKKGNVHFLSKSNEWETPQDLFDELNEKYKFVFDPCATHKNTKCDNYCTKKQDGLKEDWHLWKDEGSVFMNPPYGRKIIDAAVDVFITNWLGESITQGIVLVNNATETRWFQSLLRESSSICFPNRRIAFENDERVAWQTTCLGVHCRLFMCYVYLFRC